MHGLQQPERELLGIVEEALDLHQVEENANEASHNIVRASLHWRGFGPRQGKCLRRYVYKTLLALRPTSHLLLPWRLRLAGHAQRLPRGSGDL